MSRYAIIAALLVALVAAIVEAQAVRPGAAHDPTAARSDLSNVDPATGLSALNAERAGTVATHAAMTGTHGKAALAGVEDIPNNASFTLAGLSEKSYSSLTGKPSFGTMASETATDYLKVADLPAYPANASFTLAGLSEKSYWSLTGLPSFGTMASETATNYVLKTDIDDLSGVTDAATARTNLGVAASSSTVLTSGANAMTGDLIFSGNYGILQSTSDGADTGSTCIAGGGSTGHTRGGAVYAMGNERTTTGGQVTYYAGNVSTGDHVFYTGAGVERMRVTYGGNVLIGTETDDGTNKLQVNGSMAISTFAQLASPTAIPTAAKGRIYFNGTESKFKKCTDGSNWIDM